MAPEEKGKEIQAEITRIIRERGTLSRKLQADGHPNPKNEASRLINLKYGKGWKEKLELQDPTREYGKNLLKVSYYY